MSQAADAAGQGLEGDEPVCLAGCCTLGPWAREGPVGEEASRVGLSGALNAGLRTQAVSRRQQVPQRDPSRGGGSCAEGRLEAESLGEAGRSTRPRAVSREESAV